MGLSDMIDDDDEDTSDSNTSASSSTENNAVKTTSQSSARQYERITKDEFREFLDNLPYGFYENPDAEGNERVYECEEIVEWDDDVVLRLYSTIFVNADNARDEGDDAIRCVIWSRQEERTIGGRTKTLRIKTWRKNLREKIESLMEETREYLLFCPVCEDHVFGRNHGYLIEKSGKYGPIVGCTNYPDCTVMMTETKNNRYKIRPSQDADWMYGDSDKEVLEKLRDHVEEHGT